MKESVECGITQHATRNTQHATRNTQHATRNTQHATRKTQHATRKRCVVSTITDKTRPTIARRGGGRLNTWLNTYLRPQEPIPHQVYLAAMVITILLIFIAWGILTYGGLVNPLFLP